MPSTAFQNNKIKVEAKNKTKMTTTKKSAKYAFCS